jgi:methionyl-tRNA formyltransferase
MQGVDSTGVTLQTLDDKSFDHGAILAQTQTPVQIEGHDKITYQELLDFVTPLAADMLVKGIRDRIFIPPLPQLNLIQPSNLIYASKITPSDREIDWFDWDTQTIHRRHRALGRLWSITSSSQKSPVRTIFEDFSILEEGTPLFNHLFRRRSNPDENGEGKPWSAFTYMLHMTKQGEIKPLLYVEHGDAIAIPMKRGGVLVRNITVEGKGKRAARKAMESLEVRSFDEDDPQKMICY